MKFSYNWLQDFLVDKLPPIEELSQGIIFHAFEVEGVEELFDDYIIDIDILPNRSHDCLSHYGLAKEIAAIFNLKLKDYSVVNKLDNLDRKDNLFKIEDSEICTDYLAVILSGLKVKQSPDWLIKRLNSLGQKSINSVVDCTNYVLLSYGQPLHAFDADKVNGLISIRKACSSESIKTLDNRDLDLSDKNLVIADENNILALAGIKGGKIAEVDYQTTNLILESANFNGPTIRKTSQAFSLRTDASKRFENVISSVLVKRGMEQLIDLLLVLHPEVKIVGYQSELRSIEKKEVILSFDLVSKRLGIKIDKRKIIDILSSLGVLIEEVGDNFKCSVPFERLDLNIAEDLIEEIGRLIGYDNIPAKELPEGQKDSNDYLFDLTQKIKSYLVDKDFSEIYGYAFEVEGSVKLLNPLAKDRPYLRNNLTSNLKDKLLFNLKNVIFDNEPVKIFEIGNVFLEGKEETRVVVGIGYNKKKFNTGKQNLDDILKSLGVKNANWLIEDLLTVVEFEISEIDGFDYNKSISDFIKKDVIYKPFSIYPRIIRDIALFVPEAFDLLIIKDIIVKNAGDLLVQDPILFDEFSKDGKKSVAFRLVFQASDRTLSDQEVNNTILEVVDKLESTGELLVRK